MDEREFILVVEAEAILAQVAFNGGSVVSIHEPRPRVDSMRLRPWTLMGDNLLSVRLARFADEALPPDAVPAFRVALHHPRVGSECDWANLVAAFRYSDNECALEPGADLATVHEHRVNNVHEVGPWAWEEARPYRDGDRRAIEPLLERFGAALRDKDPAALRALLALKTVEICQALSLDLEQTELSQYRFFESFFECDDWRTSTLDPSRMALVPEADGRLVRVTAPDGGVPFRGYGGGRPFGYDVVLSCIEETWVIAR
ncbi:MAG: hypothetical protein JRI23_16540 [Deltaproteobacteria bacterium]|jgi:hypothetical protein|nr:hypothetical protein [Deltaproteobacteria bacterium]MBW2533385.1 hypothetical protein [Deltaproteobacteria bacterium]